MSKDKNDKYWVSTQYGKDSFSYDSLDRVIARLQEALAAQERGEWKNLTLEIWDDYGSNSIILTGSRPENDNERINREADELRGEEYQRRQYEALKKKFGGKDA